MNKRRLRNLHLCVDVACLCLFGAPTVRLVSQCTACGPVVLDVTSPEDLADQALAHQEEENHLYLLRLKQVWRDVTWSP